MAYDRFVVVRLDLELGFGYVQPLSSADNSQLKPIRFNVNNPCTFRYINLDIAYCLPDDRTRSRGIDIGTELVGVVARTVDSRGESMEFDVDGYPFLRNWGYGHQFDDVRDGREIDESDTYDDYDQYDDEPVSTTVVYGRALAHTRNPELAREATELYPGDFI